MALCRPQLGGIFGTHREELRSRKPRLTDIFGNLDAATLSPRPRLQDVFGNPRITTLAFEEKPQLADIFGLQLRNQQHDIHTKHCAGVTYGLGGHGSSNVAGGTRLLRRGRNDSGMNNWSGALAESVGASSQSHQEYTHKMPLDKPGTPDFLSQDSCVFTEVSPTSLASTFAGEL